MREMERCEETDERETKIREKRRVRKGCDSERRDRSYDDMQEEGDKGEM